uniref:Uncharacterized protein n=1 Tax=Anguilla anguilla TaxID=7936 RepID=A0A0E9WA07_ANGAN
MLPMHFSHNKNVVVLQDVCEFL